jgi:hypothetical protein
MSGDDYRRWADRTTENPARPTVQITFLYPFNATLMISVQDRKDGLYYDFAYKDFKAIKDATAPRAALIHVESLGLRGHVYGATIGRSARLHGQYIVTVRDVGRGGVIVAVLFYAVDNGSIADDPAAYAGGLGNYEAEKGLELPIVSAGTATRAGRAVELE